MSKTNAMRILDKKGTAYRVLEYDVSDGRIDGESVAGKIGRPAETVYKTLVARAEGRGAEGEYCVFVIPVACQLDLKMAAKAVGAKSVAMIPVADINKVTGYIRGGCSPVGMKKHYTTILDASCARLENMIVSAGKIGTQLELSPDDLASAAEARFEAVAVTS